MCYMTVSYNASGRTFNDADITPQHEYGLLLGTSPLTRDGRHNFHFANRIKATAELYNKGKIKKIIASGGDYRLKKDGSVRKYGCDEPKAMQDSLAKYGISAEDVILDYDGTRTLKSIVNAKDEYGIDSCILISQKYHNERALYLADYYGLNAVGYNAAPTPVFRNRVKNEVREIFARVKLFIDLFFS